MTGAEFNLTKGYIFVNCNLLINNMIGRIKEFCPIEKTDNRQKGPISRKYRFIPFPVSDADDSSISFASLTENGDSEPKPAGDAN